MVFSSKSSSIVLHTIRCRTPSSPILTFKSSISSASTPFLRNSSASSVFAPNRTGHVSKRRRLSSSRTAAASLDHRQLEESGSGLGSRFSCGNAGQSGSGISPSSETRGQSQQLQEDFIEMSLQDKPRSQDSGSASARGHKKEGKRRVELRELVDPRKQKSEPWQIQKDALKKKFGEGGWNPRKRLSPDTMEGIRSLHEQDPERYSTPLLAEHFKVSPEAIRRILKSKWRPSEKEMEKKRERWAKRHDRIWDQQAELGLRPKRRKERPQEDPDEFEENLRAKEMLDNARSA
ncbi:required for respiratory growth protein 9, mitochondrial [Exophiala oligosperma]|uniref:Required for respiratory growth protein 9, mitochondrial n=1 Tax=Exophiala oligosperma TaxID=215243 RepID=A0A0D2EBU4_9EURO|nr:required for respiratory growth protein 9, mitochondrial [Exophiala oligosperma]KIW45434.1 required for respiratory growth protein 9, mitochondrial [Exophiala oligosperma]